MREFSTVQGSKLLQFSCSAQSLVNLFFLFCIFVYLNNKCILNKLMEINVFELLTLFL